MVFEMATCGGCRTSEMACSFHHTGEFNPSVSSIGIVERAGQDGVCVHLEEKQYIKKTCG
jgi:Fe-S-cluster-containing dehydrogenase component